jgi:hypothetical protein
MEEVWTPLWQKFLAQDSTSEPFNEEEQVMIMLTEQPSIVKGIATLQDIFI